MATGMIGYRPRTPKRNGLWSKRPVVIARERSHEAIQTVAPAALVWIASLPLAMTIDGANKNSPALMEDSHA